MSTRLVKVSLALACLSFGASAARAADTDSSPWLGTIHLGYAKIIENSDDALYSVPSGGLDLHGGVYRLLRPALGLGLEIGYQHYGEKAYMIPAQESGDAGFSSVHFTLQGLLQDVQGTVRPFGVIGAGYYSIRTTTSGQLLLPDNTPIPGNHFEDKRTDGKFGANLGAGLQFKPSASSVRYGLDARWHMIFDTWPKKDGTKSALNALAIAAGIYFK